MATSPAARATERAERAEWNRLSAILSAHQRETAPHAHHCFCGSLEQLREAVAALPSPSGARIRTITTRGRGRHHDQLSRRRQDAARHTQRTGQQRTGQQLAVRAR